MPLHHREEGGLAGFSRQQDGQHRRSHCRPRMAIVGRPFDDGVRQGHPPIANPMPAKNPIRPADTMGLDADASSGKASSRPSRRRCHRRHQRCWRVRRCQHHRNTTWRSQNPRPAWWCRQDTGLIDGGCGRDKNPCSAGMHASSPRQVGMLPELHRRRESGGRRTHHSPGAASLHPIDPSSVGA